MSEQSDEILVVHSLRAAQKVFGIGSADTVLRWAQSGRVDATQESSGKWTIRIPPDHPDLPQNKVSSPPIHYPQLDQVRDERDIRIAELEAKLAEIVDERDFLRSQQVEYQRQLPDLVMRLVSELRPALPPPATEENRRRWYWLWLR